MSELLQVATALRRGSRTNEVSVLATVVRTEGSTYRRIGARLVVLPDGSRAGGVSPGCIESDLLLRAGRIRDARQAEVVTYDTRTPEDLVWGSGAGCGGRSDLLLEPLDPKQAALKAELLRDVGSLRWRSILATVFRASGLPLTAGDQAVLSNGGSGLSGFAQLPPQLRTVVEATARHQLRLRSSAAVLHTWDGTELDIAYEVRSPRVRLCLCGAGPDAVRLVALAKSMGWQVTLIDHRAAMLCAERWPKVKRILLHSTADAAPAIARADCDGAVVMSHNYEWDLIQLKELVAAGVAYVGVLGSRRRTLRMIEDLGLSDADAAGLHAPAGLDIGAETADEIALAIVAEVQAVFAGRAGGPLRARFGAIHDESPTRERIAAVVLAAGGSSRLGSPKQLVRYEGAPLVTRAARAALQAGADPVIVVLGANAEAVRAALFGLPVIPVVNPEWNQGMGTSIGTGVRAVIGRAPSADAVLITVADQPRVDHAALGQLLDAWSSTDRRSPDVHTTIAAAAYAETVGVPAVFGRAHFEALCSLPPAGGAARLLRAADVRVRPVSMPEAVVDLDTANDVHAFFGRMSS